MTETLPARTRTIHVPVKEPNPDQGSLLDETDSSEATIQERFERFHVENPHVYRELALIARRWKSRGHDRGSISMIFEVIRYRAGLRTRSDDFKLNNSFRSRYARLLMAREPDLAEFFETRELQNP